MPPSGVVSRGASPSSTPSSSTYVRAPWPPALPSRRRGSARARSRWTTTRAASAPAHCSMLRDRAARTSDARGAGVERAASAIAPSPASPRSIASRTCGGGRNAASARERLVDDASLAERPRRRPPRRQPSASLHAIELARRSSRRPARARPRASRRARAASHAPRSARSLARRRDRDRSPPSRPARDARRARSARGAAPRARGARRRAPRRPPQRERLDRLRERDHLGPRGQRCPGRERAPRARATSSGRARVGVRRPWRCDRRRRPRRGPRTKSTTAVPCPHRSGRVSSALVDSNRTPTPAAHLRRPHRRGSFRRRDARWSMPTSQRFAERAGVELAPLDENGYTQTRKGSATHRRQRARRSRRPPPARARDARPDIRARGALPAAARALVPHHGATRRSRSTRRRTRSSCAPCAVSRASTTRSSRTCSRPWAVADEWDDVLKREFPRLTADESPRSGRRRGAPRCVVRRRAVLRSARWRCSEKTRPATSP